MRPRLARRGELGKARTPFFKARMLQCGPGSLAGENRLTNIASYDQNGLQCGPGSLAGENLCGANPWWPRRGASMRPRLARRGEPLSVPPDNGPVEELQCGPGSLAGENLVGQFAGRRKVWASMRPRLARRGELVDPSLPPKNAGSFNAAPARSPGRTILAPKNGGRKGRLQCGPGSLAGENAPPE